MRQVREGNEWWEGTFSECSKLDAGGMQILLKAAYNITKHKKDMVKPTSEKMITCSEFVQMYAKDVGK